MFAPPKPDALAFVVASHVREVTPDIRPNPFSPNAMAFAQWRFLALAQRWLRVRRR